ncbi:MAG: hypothetical protein QT10_C0004G0049 [archaeon GW2011_AR19]|nr:MAG: hypothetical protein QT10_C0004G0049 [archaeon GW2011_AR19]
MIKLFKNNFFDFYFPCKKPKIYKQKEVEYFMWIANTNSKAIKLYKKLKILSSKENKIK